MMLQAGRIGVGHQVIAVVSCMSTGVLHHDIAGGQDRGGAPGHRRRDGVEIPESEAREHTNDEHVKVESRETRLPWGKQRMPDPLCQCAFIRDHWCRLRLCVGLRLFRR